MVSNLLVPFIVAVTCIVGFFLAFLLPRDFTPTELAKDFKRADPSLDISGIEDEEAAPERGEIIFVQIGLSVLSGFIFGFIWQGFLLRSVRELVPNMRTLGRYLLSALVPFAAIFVLLDAREKLLAAAEARGVALKINAAALVISGIVLPILPVNVVALAVLQSAVNKLYRAEDTAAVA